MTPKQAYKILWVEYTAYPPSKYCKKNTYRIISREGNFYEVERWEFIYSTPETLKEDVIKWLKEQSSIIEVFKVTKKWNNEALLTDQDL